MIVFWRLFLALCLTDFVFLQDSLVRVLKLDRWKLIAARSGLFAVLALALCHHYLTEGWPFMETVALPGWVCILLFALFHGVTDRYFELGGKMKWGHTLSFFLKNFVNILFLVLIAPFRELYESGNFFAEHWIVFLVGLVLCTYVLGWFIFAIEKDKYGRDYPTFDEQWLLAVVRAIFFLSMMLPGWRWMVVLTVWLGACMYARRSRLLDVPAWAFYVGAFGAVFIGFLVRLRFYFL